MIERLFYGLNVDKHFAVARHSQVSYGLLYYLQIYIQLQYRVYLSRDTLNIKIIRLNSCYGFLLKQRHKSFQIRKFTLFMKVF